MSTTTRKFAFILGRERELCLAELKAVLRYFCFDFCILSVTDNIVFINIDSEPEKVAELAQTLGGTIKIFELIKDSEDIKSVATEHISRSFRDKGKVVFGLSVYLASHLNLTLRKINQLGFEIKKELKKAQISSRYLELKDATEVATILSLKEKLIGKGVEFGLFPGAIGVLIGLSNPVEWNIRDYEKPAGDKYSGMLPPKLARMMVNLALGKLSIINDQRSINDQDLKNTIIDNCNLKIDHFDNIVIVDPFCGSGNILTESLMLGSDVFGSDNSAKAVRDTTANLDWLVDQISKSEFLISNQNPNSQIPIPKFSTMQADATSDDFSELLSEFHLLSSTNLAVVSEPYLGEPKKFKQTMNAARGEYDKVKDLYLKFLENFARLKNVETAVVFCIIFPLVETIEGKRYSLYRDSVDEIKKIGYTELQPPLIYGRDYQVVKREILLLTLTK